ncbi:MAG TPA: hypothetical protein VEI01_17340 [Terriglobales bacterium]|nr:hypothetical protein [Terriglobales bacterium]
MTAAPQMAARSFSTNPKAEGQVTETQSGADAAFVYRNARLGFTYQVRYGWVERTKQMQGTDPQKAQVLLAVFERPPEVSGDTVNSAVLIAMESAATYPGLKTAADYLGPLTELAVSKGFKAVEDPYEVEIGDRWLPRADFSKQRGSLTMRQSSLVMLAKGSLVSFTFIGGSGDDIEELIEGLRFAAVKANRSK